MDINLETLYAILIEVARSGGQVTYGELSEKYYDKTKDWHEPHGSWDKPLGDLNKILKGWPPLSAVVVLQDVGEPGGGFWESSPSVPARPGNDINRIGLYGKLLGQVHATAWPTAIPTKPPA